MRLFLNICSCICYIFSFYFLFASNWEHSNTAAIVFCLWGIGFILQANSFTLEYLMLRDDLRTTKIRICPVYLYEG